MSTLIAASHGTDSPTGQQAIADLRAQIATHRPDLTVLEAYVDVQEPRVADVAAANPGSVIVPLLLTTGYHVKTDIAEAAAASGSVAAEPLGPDPCLIQALADHLADMNYDGVVLASAGSSDPAAREAMEEIAAELSLLVSVPIILGFAASDSPTVTEAIQKAHREVENVAVAAYLLAPGVFYDRIVEEANAAGAVGVTPPLLPNENLADLVLERYEDAAANLP